MPPILDLCRDLPVWSYEPGDTIIHEDRKDGRLYILKKGAVEVRKHGQSVTATTTPGAIFGEISALLRASHSASVVAIEDSEFFVADPAEAFLQANPSLNLHIARLLAFRLQRVTQQLADLQELTGASGLSPTTRVTSVLRTLADQF
ncbi:MAG: cAMP-dependent protein kinase [Verrucomicrobia bacterium]|jgi:CRP-like cAMP-binding protein|nr:MAG: cAMP-dependent protein kinase [Verrucomicrobiota bacterium]